MEINDDFSNALDVYHFDCCKNYKYCIVCHYCDFIAGLSRPGAPEEEDWFAASMEFIKYDK